MNKDAYAKLPDVVGVLEEFYGRLKLQQHHERTLLAHVRTIKGQLYQGAPNDAVVSEHLLAIREILRPQADNELANAAVMEIDRMIGSREKGGAHSTSQAGRSSAGGSGAVLTGLCGLAIAAGAALAVFGGWLVNDGLLGGYLADRREMAIGVGFLAVGVFVLMLGVRGLVRSALWRTVIGAVVLLSVVAFAASAASLSAGRDATIDLGRDPEFVTVVGTGRKTAVPPEAIRPPRWYEDGIEVSVESDYRETTVTIPRKYVVTAEPQ